MDNVMDKQDKKVLKVCIDPTCEAVAHNCPKKETHCRDCNMILVEIDKKTYETKFINNFFQYDYNTDELVTPAQMGYSKQIQLDLQ